jgi:hypothetical protein
MLSTRIVTLITDHKAVYYLETHAIVNSKMVGMVGQNL